MVEILPQEIFGIYEGQLEGTIVNEEGTDLEISGLDDKVPAFMRSFIFVAWVVVDFNLNKVSFMELYSSLDEVLTETSVHIDLSAVLSTPRSLPTTIAFREVQFDVFTYEANILPIYNEDHDVVGSKRYSFPTRMVLPANMSLSKSTDGIYIVSQQFVAPDADLDLLKKDIVMGFPGNDGIIANMVITKYLKDTLFTDALLKTSFKKYDDYQALADANKLYNFRHKAVALAKHNEVIGADYALVQANRIIPNQVQINELKFML